MPSFGILSYLGLWDRRTLFLALIVDLCLAIPRSPLAKDLVPSHLIWSFGLLFGAKLKATGLDGLPDANPKA